MLKLQRILFLLLVMAFAVAQGQEAAAKPFVLVLDPGHGGSDVGALGKYSKEKDINMTVARILGSKIKKKYGDDVKVVYTRDNDSYVSLEERGEKANQAKADLFLSIHCNSLEPNSPKRNSIEGVEVYVVNIDRSESKAQQMMKYRKLLQSKKKNSKGEPTNYNSKSHGSRIAFDLQHEADREKSIDFADMIHKRMRKTAGRADRLVRQAGFRVLWLTSMPAVLVELDFICNPAKEDFLASEDGQEKCAQALFEAFNDYYKKYK